MMKIRIQNQEIRVRIDHSEVAKLLNHELVLLTAPLGIDQVLQVSLQTTGANSLKTEISIHQWNIQIPQDNVLAWSQNSLITYSHEFVSASGNSGKFVFEVDLKRESQQQ
jgi:hypothetical protein